MVLTDRYCPTQYDTMGCWFITNNGVGWPDVFQDCEGEDGDIPGVQDGKTFTPVSHRRCHSATWSSGADVVKGQGATPTPVTPAVSNCRAGSAPAGEGGGAASPTGSANASGSGSASSPTSPGAGASGASSGSPDAAGVSGASGASGSAALVPTETCVPCAGAGASGASGSGGGATGAGGTGPAVSTGTIEVGMGPMTSEGGSLSVAAGAQATASGSGGGDLLQKRQEEGAGGAASGSATSGSAGDASAATSGAASGASSGSSGSAPASGAGPTVTKGDQCCFTTYLPGLWSRDRSRSQAYRYGRSRRLRHRHRLAPVQRNVRHGQRQRHRGSRRQRIDLCHGRCSRWEQQRQRNFFRQRCDGRCGVQHGLGRWRRDCISARRRWGPECAVERHTGDAIPCLGATFGVTRHMRSYTRLLCAILLSADPRPVMI